MLHKEFTFFPNYLKLEKKFTFFFLNCLKLEMGGQEAPSQICWWSISWSPTQNFTTETAYNQAASWPVKTRVPPTKTLKSNLKYLAKFPDELIKKNSVVNQWSFSKSTFSISPSIAHRSQELPQYLVTCYSKVWFTDQQHWHYLGTC